mmetsp:Transcript_1711/g.4733  ORF Transcript_1711/g.4733 Transcript_1711/m.4733 type:complete len:237 (+) Transcript_1711:116-826(+)
MQWRPRVGQQRAFPDSASRRGEALPTQMADVGCELCTASVLNVARLARSSREFLRHCGDLAAITTSPRRRVSKAPATVRAMQREICPHIGFPRRWACRLFPASTGRCTTSKLVPRASITSSVCHKAGMLTLTFCGANDDILRLSDNPWPRRPRAPRQTRSSSMAPSRKPTAVWRDMDAECPREAELPFNEMRMVEFRYIMLPSSFHASNRIAMLLWKSSETVYKLSFADKAVHCLM